MVNHPSRRRWTYTRQLAAHYGDQIVTVPDQVAADQRGFADADQSFPVVLSGGRKVRVKIDADATGLYTTGTGDLVLRQA